MLSALFIKEAAAAFPAASSCQTHLAFQTPQRSCSSLPLNLLYRGFAQAVPLPVDFSRLNFILHYVNQLECHHLHNFPSLSPSAGRAVHFLLFPNTLQAPLLECMALVMC